MVISDQLDVATLDLSTFELGPISFGDRTLNPPKAVREFHSEVDMRPATELIARIDAELDPATGLATWRFSSIDPETLQPTLDPLAGFLPANALPSEGEGSVLFTVSPRPALPSGTRIDNGARIVFDTNAPIDTPLWSNTIDAAKPSSSVASLAATQASPAFPVQWSGTDLHSGVASFSVFVSQDGGPFQPWLRNTTETSATYPGETGRSYGFYSLARDHTGNLENAKSAPEATTIVADPDPIAPVTSFTLSAASNAAGWHRADVTLTLTAADVGSGVREIGYTAVGAQSAAGATTPGSVASILVTVEGVTEISFFATDEAGNAETPQTIVVRLDKTAPSLTPPAAFEVRSNDGCAYAGGVGRATATDNASLSGELTIANDAPARFPLGTTTVNWSATDAAGNWSPATQLVTVVDRDVPALVVPPALTVGTNVGATYVGSIGQATASDGCTSSDALLVVSDAPGALPLGDTRVTWTARDAAGNASAAVQVVTVVDDDAPSVTPPPASTFGTNLGCGYVGPIGIASALDNASTGPALVVTRNAPPTFPLGDTTVTWTATDAAGNSSSATQVVTVVDDDPATLTVPATVDASADGACGAAIPQTVSAVDNCSGAVTITHDAPARFPLGATLVSFRAVDGHGNVATASSMVTVVDRTPPAILGCPPARTLLGNETGEGIALPDLTSELGATDNCAVSAIQQPPAGTPITAGDTSVDLTVVDPSGNAASCTSSVRVLDRLLSYDERINVHFQRDLGADRDDECGESDDDAHDGDAGPRRPRCFTRLDARGGMRMRNAATRPTDIRGPQRQTVEARVRLSLSGSLVAEQAVSLSVKDAQDERWDWRRREDTPRTGLRSLSLKWREWASYDSQRGDRDPAVPRLVAKTIGHEETDLQILHHSVPRPYTISFDGPSGPFRITVHDAAGASTTSRVGSFGRKARRGSLRIALPFRLTPETRIAFSTDGESTWTPIPVDPETNYSPAGAHYSLEVDRTELADAACRAVPPTLTSESEPTLEIELQLGSGSNAVVGVVAVDPGDWTRVDSRHWKRRRDPRVADERRMP